MHCPKIWSWRLIDIACILAALIQLGFILEGFIRPTLLNTSVKEIDLQEIDFPIEIKICAQPGFNESLLKDLGYDQGIWSYFLGKSRFNRSIIGWAGHTADFGVKGSVQEVFNMVRTYNIEDIIAGSRIQFSSGWYQYLPLQQFHHAERVNYPQNCFRFNLTFLNEMRRWERVKTLELYFKTANIERVQLDFQGGSLKANRDIYDNAFDTIGDSILNAEPGTVNKYAVEIAGNSYLEEDTSKKCREYPNSEYASYKDCDDQYMKDICEKVGLAPVWLMDDFNLVTKKAVIDDTGC